MWHMLVEVALPTFLGMFAGVALVGWLLTRRL